MKKKFLCICFLCLLALTVFAQVSTDPRDPIYEDIVVWENLGLLKNLSPIRPYPLEVLRAILETVKESSYPVQAALARDHYERIFTKPLSAGLEYKLQTSFPDGEDAVIQHLPGAVIFGDLFLNKIASFSYDLSFLATNLFRPDVLPRFTLPDEDSPWDPADFGSMTGLMSLNMTGAFVFDSLYIQGGVSRSSWGPFYNSGVTLTSSAFHSGNINVFYNGSDKWNYAHSLFILGATDNQGQLLHPDKYMVLHSIEFNPFNWLSVSYYENIIYGGRLDPIYFLPVPFMAAQSIGSYTDNLQMGVAFEVRPFNGFLWAADILVDDFSMNEMVRLDFDTKIKIGAITGIQYAFNKDILKLVNANYTLIAPYMYTHEDTNETNFQNYTNNGMPIGSSLPPNSDRIHLDIVLTPVKNLSVTVRGDFIRHANINESIPYDDAIDYLSGLENASGTDGSIFNYANAGRGYLNYAQENFMFMAQQTKMLVFQTGIDLSYTLHTGKFGTLAANLGWTFEYIKNNGVTRPMFPNRVAIPTNTDVDVARNTWRAGLYDSLTNYVKLSISYTY